MIRRLLPALLLFALTVAPVAPARDKTETWLQISTPHFLVLTNGNEKDGRKVAVQLERMRMVFHTMLPSLKGDSGAPIIVLAIKDEKDFRALEPQAYLAKGSLRIGGLFLRAADKNYVLLRLNPEGDHPYSIVYHEYTHLLLSGAAEWIPLWLNEGLAEFYQNTDIHEKEADLGQPSAEDISWLRQTQLIPLSTLFAVDDKSPYYHEENKGSIFYSESWALVHFLKSNDARNKTHLVGDYADLLVKHVDPVTAAGQAFGDLKKLEAALNRYVQSLAFTYFKLPITTEVDESTFKVKTLAPAQSDAQRADFLAYNQRTDDAQALLAQVLKEDPNNVLAHETKGFMEFRQGHLAEAKKWYEQAVQLDSQSYLAHYYYAAITMNEGTIDAQVETSLRTAIKLNADFAPAYDRMAVLLAMGHKNLDEARLMGVTAVSLDPSNVAFRINVANVFMQMQQPQNAINVLRAAAKVAKSQQDSQMVDNALMHAQEYAEAQGHFEKMKDQMNARVTTRQSEAEGAPDAPRLARSKPFVAVSGPHKFVTGVLKGVRCDAPVLALNVVSAGKTLALLADNYYKLEFTALNFQPSGDLNPCKDLENRPAKVEYMEPADKAETPMLVSIELHK